MTSLEKSADHKGHKGLWVSIAIALAATALPHAQTTAPSKTRAYVTALASEKL
jgi:hypothetical protein